MARENLTLVYREASRWLRGKYFFYLEQHGASLQANSVRLFSFKKNQISSQQAKDFAAQMIGSKLITKQTGAAGRICNAVCVQGFRKKFLLSPDLIYSIDRSCLPNVVNRRMNTMSQF